jgi:hypothetical protein
VSGIIEEIMPMENFILYALLVLILAMIIVTLAFTQSEQTSQLRAIYERLAQLKSKEKSLETGDSLRRDRSAYIDNLVVLEADVATSKRDELTEEELFMIQTARGMIKMYNDKLVQMNEWMGPPFDLEWPEQFERFPLIKKIYLASALELEQAEAAQPVPADHLLASPPTSNN